MNGTVKFVIGGLFTALLAMASHSSLGLGGAFITKLEGSAQTALGNAGGTGVTLNFERDPTLRRFAILSGAADAATRDRLLAAVRAVPGIAGARWAVGEGALAVAAPAEASATPETVATCQRQTDSATAGTTVQFAPGSAEIAATSMALIDALAAALGPCEGIVVQIAGHTDAAGAPIANQMLSEQRAAAVAVALAGKGVPASRLAPRGFGSTQPKVVGRSLAADAANRRIEFQVTSNNPVATTARAVEAQTTSAPTSTGGY